MAGSSLSDQILYHTQRNDQPNDPSETPPSLNKGIELPKEELQRLMRLNRETAIKPFYEQYLTSAHVSDVEVTPSTVRQTMSHALSVWKAYHPCDDRIFQLAVCPLFEGEARWNFMGWKENEKYLVFKGDADLLPVFLQHWKDFIEEEGKIWEVVFRAPSKLRWPLNGLNKNLTYSQFADQVEVVDCVLYLKATEEQRSHSIILVPNGVGDPDVTPIPWDTDDEDIMPFASAAEGRQDGSEATQDIGEARLRETGQSSKDAGNAVKAQANSLESEYIPYSPTIRVDGIANGRLYWHTDFLSNDQNSNKPNENTDAQTSGFANGYVNINGQELSGVSCRDVEITRKRSLEMSRGASTTEEETARLVNSIRRSLRSFGKDATGNNRIATRTNQRKGDVIDAPTNQGDRVSLEQKARPSPESKENHGPGSVDAAYASGNSITGRYRLREKSRKSLG